MRADAISLNSTELAKLDIHFSVRHLEPDRFHLVFPLIQAVAPDLAIEDWLGFADNMDGSGGGRGAGVVAVESSSGYFHGFFTYRTVWDLHCGWTLVVDNYVVAELLNKAAGRLLVDEMERMAADRGYKAVHIEMRPRDPRLAPDAAAGKLFPEMGYSCESLRLCKRLV